MPISVYGLGIVLGFQVQINNEFCTICTDDPSKETSILCCCSWRRTLWTLSFKYRDGSWYS